MTRDRRPRLRTVDRTRAHDGPPRGGDGRARPAPRPIEFTRGAYGLVLLVAPDRMLNIGDAPLDRRSATVIRVLGARQFMQAVSSGVRPSPEVLAMGVWVDAVHAVSVVALALVDRTRARAALIDTALALAWVGVGFRDAGRAGPSGHQHLRERAAVAVLSRVPGGGVLLRRIHPSR